MQELGEKTFGKGTYSWMNRKGDLLKIILRIKIVRT